MEIRPIRPSDAAGIAAYHARAWRIAYDGLIPDETIARMGYETRLAQWNEYVSDIDTHESRCLVAGVGSVPVGHVMTHRDELVQLYLDPDYWGLGYGRALLQAGTDQLRATGAGTARLVTLNVETQSAYRLYRSQGWQPGEVRPSGQCGGADEVVMTLDLN